MVLHENYYKQFARHAQKKGMSIVRGYLTPKKTPKGIHHRRTPVKTKSYSNSSAQTNQHRALENSTGMATHADLSTEKLNVTLHKPSKRHSKSLGKFEYLHESSSVTQCTEGQQQVCNVPFSGTLKQILVDSASGSYAVNNPNTWAINPFDLNPDLFATGGPFTTAGKAIVAGTTLSAGTVSRPTIDQVYFKSANLMYMVTNLSNVPCYVDCMWFVPKMDLPATDITQAAYLAGFPANPDGFDSTVTGTPLQIWNQALSQRGWGQTNPVYSGTAGNNVTGGRAFHTAYGMSPLSEAPFRKAFKLVGRKTFTLQDGETHRIMAKVHFNKLLDKETLTNVYNTGNVDLKAGLTLCPLFIVRPSAVAIDGATAGVPTPNTTGSQYVTTGSTKIGVVHSGYYHFEAVEKAKKFELTRVNPGFLSYAAAGPGSASTAVEAIINAVDGLTRTLVA